MTTHIFGIAETALKLTEERASILTNNIANASTPHYKARDIDFSKALQEAQSALASGSANASSEVSADNTRLLYRVPMQKSLDGNTVDDNIERKNFLQNSLRYQVSITYIQNKSDELMKAMRGE
jgi:flagellar basal-body rod protein FlgB